jgi:hypothetical protein
LVGVIWIVLMMAICYVGIEVSTNGQKVPLGIELTFLILFAELLRRRRPGNPRDGRRPGAHATTTLEGGESAHRVAGGDDLRRHVSVDVGESVRALADA